jgi:hypothetical protein
MQQRYQPFADERVEINRWGEGALDFSVNQNGSGRFRLNRWPRVDVGTFQLTPEEYSDFRARLDQFRRDAKPFASHQFNEPRILRCENGRPTTSHAGGIVVRWVDQGRDDVLDVVLGCPFASTKKRDDDLKAFVFGYWETIEQNITKAEGR